MKTDMGGGMVLTCIYRNVCLMPADRFFKTIIINPSVITFKTVISRQRLNKKKKIKRGSKSYWGRAKSSCKKKISCSKTDSKTENAAEKQICGWCRNILFAKKVKPLFPSGPLCKEYSLKKRIYWRIFKLKLEASKLLLFKVVFNCPK